MLPTAPCGGGGWGAGRCHRELLHPGASWQGPASWEGQAVPSAEWDWDWSPGTRLEASWLLCPSWNVGSTRGQSMCPISSAGLLFGGLSPVHLEDPTSPLPWSAPSAWGLGAGPAGPGHSAHQDPGHPGSPARGPFSQSSKAGRESQAREATARSCWLWGAGGLYTDFPGTLA